MNIDSIKLLRGHYYNTNTTGRGCFMDIVAYLNGDPQITDSSPCVCYMIRPLVIRLNDHATDEQRQRLIPFLLRALGSATDDEVVISERLSLLHKFSVECQGAIDAWLSEMRAYNPDASASTFTYTYANDYTHTHVYSSDYAHVVYAHAYARDYAKTFGFAKKFTYSDFGSADEATKRAWANALKERLFCINLKLLDLALPQAAEPSDAIAKRIQELISMKAQAE